MKLKLHVVRLVGSSIVHEELPLPSNVLAINIEDPTGAWFEITDTRPEDDETQRGIRIDLPKAGMIIKPVANNVIIIKEAP